MRTSGTKLKMADDAWRAWNPGGNACLGSREARSRERDVVGNLLC